MKEQDDVDESLNVETPLGRVKQDTQGHIETHSMSVEKFSRYTCAQQFLEINRDLDCTQAYDVAPGIDDLGK